MGAFITVNPFNTNEWWEVSGNTRKLCSNSQKSFLQFTGVTPFPIAADWFVSYPIASG